MDYRDETKNEANEMTRGYYIDGNIVFYKENFTYDNDLISDAMKFYIFINLQ